jgi:HTH-type transcriptional regulator/antitoxin HigA
MATNTQIPPFGPPTRPERLPESVTNMTPGDFLRQELAALGLNQGELATKTNLSPKHINQVIKNVVPISTDTALRIERATGLSATLLTTLQARKDAEDGRESARRHLVTYADWFHGFPHYELTQRNVIRDSDALEQQIDDLLHFFGVADPEAFDEQFADSLVSFRRAQHLTVSPEATALWLRLGERAAEEMLRTEPVPPYSRKAFQNLLEKLPALTKERPPASFDRLAAMCREAGVLVVFLNGLDRTRVNAVTRWVSNRPVLILTDRGKFEDTIWFNFFHEAGHVLLHPKRRSAINLGPDGDDENGSESEANDFATDKLLRGAPKALLRGVTSVASAKEVAAELDIDHGIVAGLAAFAHNRYSTLQKGRRKYSFAS